MDNVAQVSTDVNTDNEWTDYDCAQFDRRTDEAEKPLAELLEESYREDRAARWGFWVYGALVKEWGSEVAGKAARATYNRLKNLDNLDIALDAVPYYELTPVPTFWRGE